MKNPTLTKTIILDADVETVWEFLTDKNKLGEWFHAAEDHLTLGSDYQLNGSEEDGSLVRRCWGQVLEMVRPKKLVYTFTIDPLNGEMTTVTWELETVHGGTRLTLLHEGIEEAAGSTLLPLLLALDTGWDSHLLHLRQAAQG